MQGSCWDATEMSTNPSGLCAINLEVSEPPSVHVLTVAVNRVQAFPGPRDKLTVCVVPHIFFMRRVSPRAFESINSSWFSVHAQMLMYLLISASNFLLLPTRRRAFWQLRRYKCEKDKWLITGLFNAEAGETPSFRRRYRRLKRRGSPRCW